MVAVIASPNKHTGRRAPIRLVVIHTMEVDETGSVAEAVGNAFARPATGASAHIGVDTDSTVRYVPDTDTAWAAPGANADGLQIELAGRAGQTTGQWADAASKAILERAAQQTATWCKAYGIQVRHLNDAQLGDGKSVGIVGHADVSRVFKRSTHWDPGPAFPWGAFLARVGAILGYPCKPIPTTAPTTPKRPLSVPVSTRPPQIAVDGLLGQGTIRRWQQWAGVTADGVLGPCSWRAIQAKVHVTPDGCPGPQTWRAIQRIVGAKDDGQPGPNTYRALQMYLNRI